MTRLFKKVDIVGLFSSSICAVHCVALPVLLSLGILEGIAHSALHSITELIVLLATLLFVLISGYQGSKIHKELTPYLLFGIGLIMIFLGFILSNHWTMGIGGFCVAIGHFVNYRLIQRLPII